MNKFIKAIAGTAEGIKLQRAQNAASATTTYQEWFSETPTAS